MPRAKAELSAATDVDPALRQNEDRFGRLLEAAPDAILEVNAEGRITLANAAAQRIFV